jgi:hypothetical protein
MKPATTRLRYVSAKRPELLVLFLSRLGFRVQIYGSPVWDGKRWFLWFVPPDDIAIDIKSVDLS